MAVKFAGTSASTELLKQVFQGINAESCPTRFNFHMHTIYSDGRLEPSELMEQAINIGLEGLAISDHHTVDGYKVAQIWLENWKWKHPDINAPYLWSGVEINANLLDIEVHILGYGFDLQHPSLKPYIQKKATCDDAYQAINVVRAIHQAGGLAVLAHPARYRKSHFELIPAAVKAGIDGVESFYAYNNPNPWKPSSLQTQQVQQLATEYHLYSTCGTDTHGLSMLTRL